MTSSLVLTVALAWGIPFSAPPHADESYLGVIEKIAGHPVWVRATFKRDGRGDWAPTIALETVRGSDSFAAATAALPARVTWRACREGRSLGTIISERRLSPIAAELGTHALRSGAAFADAAPDDERFRIVMTDTAAARPFVISTQRDACGIGLAVRRGDADAVARVARLVLAQRNLHTGKPNQLMEARGWQAGSFTIVEVMLEEDGAWLAVVAFATEDDVRYTVKGARVVDWISADGDGVPDVVLWIDGYNRSGYLLVYGNFEKQAEFDWLYR